MQENKEILVVAPARSVTPAQLEQGIEWVQQHGFRVRLGKHIYNQFRLGYTYSGTVEERLEDVQWALDHPTAKVIWMAAGGYGTIHLLQKLDWTLFDKNPKWICGYSDITALHLALAQRNRPSIHGTVIKPIADVHYEKETYTSVLKIFNGQLPTFSIEPHAHNKRGSVLAPIRGGNLSLLYSVLGTPFNLPCEPFILFIEDWYENWYHLDRMLHALRMNPIWENIAGLLVGSFTRMDVQEENEAFSEPFDPMSYRIIQQHFADKQIPQAFGFSAGHIGRNLAFPLGILTELRVEENKAILDFGSSEALS